MKKSILASMITVMLLSGSFVPAIQAAPSGAHTYRVTYKMPTINTLEEVELLYSLLKDSLQVKNPYDAALVEKNRMDIYEIVADLYGTDSIRSFMIDEMYLSRNGYLLELFNHIGVLEPVYPAGYDPVTIKQQIAKLAASEKWEQYAEFRNKRGQIELDLFMAD